MKVVACTGASGFIGMALSRALLNAGHRVIGLSRAASGDAAILPWQLGEALPPPAALADVVIHLASATLVEKVDRDQATRRDIDGSRVLIEQIRSLRRHDRRIRFVFISSQSARCEAINLYGLSKWRTEQLLMQNDEVIVRPGLVFDDAGSSVFGLLKALSRLPLVPDVGDRPAIQPIHIDDLVKCLVRIVEEKDCLPNYNLGAALPMTLTETIKAIARAEDRRPPTAIALSDSLVGIGARVLDTVLRPVPSLSERVNGLIGLTPMETTDSLQALGVELRSIEERTAA